MSGVDGVDPRGTRLEQDAGEAAGRRAEVERDATGGLHGEAPEGRAQLRRTARRPPVDDADRVAAGHEGGRIRDREAVDEHPSLGDQAHGLRQGRKPAAQLADQGLTQLPGH